MKGSNERIKNFGNNTNGNGISSTNNKSNYYNQGKILS